MDTRTVLPWIRDLVEEEIISEANQNAAMNWSTPTEEFPGDVVLIAQFGSRTQYETAIN